MKNRLFRELGYFQSLGSQVQKLLFSYGFYEAAVPLLNIFINTFILRKTQGFVPLTIYNVGTFISLPITFYINGLLLKKVSIKKMYSIGLVGQGLVVALVFFVDGLSSLSLFVFGLLNGIVHGLFWANRNYFSLAVTNDQNRNYFSGLEATITTLTGLIFPIIYGGVLHWARKTGLISLDQAYQLLIVLVTMMLAYGSWIVYRMKIDNPQVGTVYLKKVSTNWWFQRTIEMLRGIMNGLLFFIPTMMLVKLGGQEGSLGVMQTVTAIMGMILSYSIGRKMKVNQRVSLIKAIVIGWIATTLPFVFTGQAVFAFLFIVMLPALESIIWQAMNPLAMRVIDDEFENSEHDHYSFIFDRELFLNIGRMVGMGVFLAVIYLFSDEVALRYIPLLMVTSQIGVWWCARRLVASS